MRLTMYAQDVIIPAIKKASLINGKPITYGEAIELYEQKMKELGGPNHYSFVAWWKGQISESKKLVMTFK